MSRYTDVPLSQCHNGPAHPEPHPTSSNTLDAMNDDPSKAGNPSESAEATPDNPGASPLPAPRQSRLPFVLRLWSEPDGAGTERSPLRGSVERMDTHELRYFDQLSSLEGLLGEMAGDAQFDGLNAPPIAP
jgi:hypothetical protein